MRHFQLSRFGLVLMALLTASQLNASDAEFLRQQAKMLQKAATAVAERGHGELGAQLKVRSVELLEAAEQSELQAREGREAPQREAAEQETTELAERLQDLRAQEQKLRENHGPGEELKEVQQLIEKLQRRMKQLASAEQGPAEDRSDFAPAAEKLAAAGRRIHHLQLAAQNLKMAEAHDLAHEAMLKAEALEREVQEGKKRLATELKNARGKEFRPETVRELREEIELLRTEVKELHRQLRKK